MEKRFEELDEETKDVVERLENAIEVVKEEEFEKGRVKGWSDSYLYVGGTLVVTGVMMKLVSKLFMD